MNRVARAAVVGLATALFLAGVTLGVLGLLRMRVDCASLGAEECAFETQLATGVARLQAFGALGCLLVSTGMALGLRRGRG